MSVGIFRKIEQMSDLVWFNFMLSYNSRHKLQIASQQVKLHFTQDFSLFLVLSLLQSSFTSPYNMMMHVQKSHYIDYHKDVPIFLEAMSHQKILITL